MKRTLYLILLSIFLFNGAIFSQDQKQVWSLEDCIKYAIENNIQIKQQVIQTQVQQNSLDLAKMKLLPTVNGAFSHNYDFGRALDQATYEFYNQTLKSDYAYFGGETPLFTGMQNINSIKKKKYEVLAAKEDLQYIKDDVALNVALAYLQILLDKDLVAANQNQVNITKQQIEKTRKLVDAGSVAKGNLLQIEAQAAKEELQLITMKNQLEASYLNITQFLELKSSSGFEIVVPQIPVDTNSVISGTVDEIYQLAAGNRPEIRSSEMRLAASEYDLKIAKGGRSPRLSLNYSFNTRYTFIESITNQSFSYQFRNNKTSGVGLSLNIPILNGWQVNKNISNSRLNVESSKYSLEGSKKQLYKSIQKAFSDAVAAMKKYNSSLKAVVSSEESFRYTEQKFNVGMVTSVDYNASKTLLLNAQADMSQAKYEYIFKTKVLDFYKGIPLTLDSK
jgi:outer membrane protein